MSANLIHGATLGEAGIESFSPIARIIMRQHKRNSSGLYRKFAGKISTTISITEDGDAHERVTLYSERLADEYLMVYTIILINGKFDSFSTRSVAADGERNKFHQNCRDARFLTPFLMSNENLWAEDDIYFGYQNHMANLIASAEWDELQEEANLLQEMYHDCDTPFPEAARERRNELASLGADINFGWVPSY